MFDERYDKLEDTRDHEQNLLILCEQRTCFGTDISDLAIRIEDRINREELTVQEYPHPLNQLDDTERLIENSIWFVNWEECLEERDTYPHLESIMKKVNFPEYAEAIIYTEEGDRQKANEIENQFLGMMAAHSKESLCSKAEVHFNQINPIYRSGRKKLKNWNNEIWERVKL